MRRTLFYLLTILYSFSSCRIKNFNEIETICDDFSKNDTFYCIIDKNKYPINIQVEKNETSEYHQVKLTFNTIYIIPNELAMDTTALNKTIYSISKIVFNGIANNDEFVMKYAKKKSINGICKSHLWDESFNTEIDASPLLNEFSHFIRGRDSQVYQFKYTLKKLNISKVKF